MDVQNIKIEAMDAIFGEDRAQVQKVITVADESSSLQNKYFFLYEPDNTKYHVWFNVGGAGVDPAPAGSTGIVVAISANASANAVATALQGAVDGHADFIATVSGNQVTITNVANGYAPPIGVASSVTEPGFVYSLMTQGSLEANLGCIQGSIELTAEEQKVAVTCHQTGTNEVAELRTGNSLEMSFTLQETDIATLKKVFVQAGSSYVPVGANATEVFGIGTKNLFGNTFSQAQRLVLHPKRLPSSDHSADWCFWKAYMSIDTVTFSGEEVMTLPVTVKVYQDESKDPSINRMLIGDWTQI